MRRATQLLPWWLLALTLGLASPASAQAPGTWARVVDLNQPRAEHTATLLANGTVLIAGGRDAAGQPLASAEIGDPAKGRYTLLASPLPAPVWGHTATRLDDGAVLIAGGTGDGGLPVAAAQLFDPATGTFTALNPMSTPRGRHTATLLRDGRVLIAGGTDGSSALASLEIYDPGTRTFSSASQILAMPRQSHTATVLPDGRVLLTGGSNSAGALYSAELYDPAGDTVAPAGRLNVPRTLASAALLLDGTVLVAGGQTTTGEDLDSAEVYDAATNAFAWLRAPMGTARSGHLGMQLLHNGKVLISGGTSGGQLVPSAEVYDPVTGAFQVVDSPGTARRLFGANFFELPYTGILLASGGLDGAKTPLASSEVLFYPTLRSDKLNYEPGETVTLMGERWLPGETVAINIRESSGDPDTNLTVTADAQGAITNTEFQTNPNRSDVGVRFLVTASGRQSRWTAQTVFTDGNRTFDQCQDDTNDDNVKDPCVWINGSIHPSISAYHEGDSVAFRIWLDGLTPGSTHTVTIRYDFTKQTSGGVIVLGYDYLTHPDATETAIGASSSQRCTDIPGPIGTSPAACAAMSGPSTITIPPDTFAFSSLLSGVNAALASQAVATREAANPALKQIVLFGGTFTLTGITSISKVGDPNTASDSQSELTITFTVSSGPDSAAACTGPASNKNCRVNILFGGHLAKGTTDASGWGSGRGASSFPGAAISMRMHLIDGDSSGAVNRSIQPAAVIPSPQTDLAITKTDAPDPVVAGSPLTYTLMVTNNGPSSSTGATVVDTLPLGVTFVSAPGCTFTSPSTVTCPVGPLALAASASFTIVVTVNSGTTGMLTNSASVTGNEADPTPGNNMATATTMVLAQTDLAITKTDAPDPVVAGSPLTYTLMVTNNGPSSSTGATVVDTLPLGVTFVSAPGCTFTSPSTVTCPVGPLALAASASFTIVVTVNSGTTGTLTNSASVTGNEPDLAPGNNMATAMTMVVQPMVIKHPTTTTVRCQQSFLPFVDLTRPNVMLAWGFQRCTATVIDAIPTPPFASGTVSFFADEATTAFASCTISGTAQTQSCSVDASIPVGTHVITAKYSGDKDHEGSMGVTAFMVAVVPGAPGKVTRGGQSDVVASNGTANFGSVVRRRSPADIRAL